MKYFFSLFAVSTLIFSETSIVAETKINQKVIIESNDLMKFDKTSIKLSKGVTYDIVLKNVLFLQREIMKKQAEQLKLGCLEKCQEFFHKFQ